MQLRCALMLTTIALLALPAGTARAQDGKCTLSGGALAFGAYNPGFVAHLDVTGSVTMDCKGKVQAQLGMSVGTGTGASYGAGRIMTGSTGGLLRYNLYVDPSRTLVLGDGTGGSARLNMTIQGPVTQSFWGRIPSGQTAVPTGLYSDVLIATISY